jgi:hypothetical protein
VALIKRLYDAWFFAEQFTLKMFDGRLPLGAVIANCKDGGRRGTVDAGNRLTIARS